LKKLYSKFGRPSIAPKKLLRALLLQTLYSIRSERQLMEQLDYNLLFRWFVGLNMDDNVWDATTFCKNRERLLKSDIATAFSQHVLVRAREHDLLSEEHFTVDGTLFEAAASLKSFKNKNDKDGPPLMTLAIPRSTFMARNVRIRRLNPQPTLTRRGARKAKKRS
jgi:transposase